VRAAAWLGVIACAGACRTAARPEKAEASADAGAEVNADAGAMADANANAEASADASLADRQHGPFEVPLEGARKVYYVVPRQKGNGRLIANLHGVCNPPGYACGYWVEAASRAGFLVCPEGNSHCGPNGPPTWTEPAAKMDADLERAIAIVDANHPGEMNREGSVLTGFSMGAYAAVQIARNHPGRWPHLVLNEADVPLDVAQLRAAGVRAVALVAGEIGSQVAGERRTAEKLAKHGFPARLWVMKGAGHYYSADIDTIMAEAIAFVLSASADATGDSGAAR
jgi:pimeloyl-ACP methyl ester carboxylesterase